MAAARSENGRLAVAAGYAPGTREYSNYMRTLQRYTTTAGERRRATEAGLSKLTPEQAQAVRNRQAVRDAGTPQVGQRVRMVARIVVGDSPAEQRRATQIRTVTSAHPLTPEAIQLLLENPRAFWNADFFGLDVAAGDDADGYGIETLIIRSIAYV